MAVSIKKLRKEALKSMVLFFFVNLNDTINGMYDQMTYPDTVRSQI